LIGDSEISVLSVQRRPRRRGALDVRHPCRREINTREKRKNGVRRTPGTFLKMPKPISSLPASNLFQNRSEIIID